MGFARTARQFAGAWVGGAQRRLPRVKCSHPSVAGGATRAGFVWMAPLFAGVVMM